MRYEKELTHAMRIARSAGDNILMRYFGRDIDVRQKENNTPVTCADLESNSFIVSELQKVFPDDGFISEESGILSAERKWVIDPLDGTKQFIRRVPDFAVHIGLVAGNRAPIVGVVYRPIDRTLYFGGPEIGAFKDNSQKVVPLKCTSSSDALIAVISSGSSDTGIERIIGATSFVRSGGEGLRMMKLLENVADFRIAYKACAWDVCAPEAILSGGGGIVRHFDGSVITHENSSLLPPIISARNNYCASLVTHHLKCVRP
ncbi:3'(2'),5'-bisphosphate nucleotidase CysQ [Candidatus Woesearchaeota archaeon]|nr:3'(2'),5'-bisphosphate nucleotidase CysQ [Candidatus Woesearchaeota archaeon]